MSDLEIDGNLRELLVSACEALIYASDKPLSVDKLADILRDNPVQGMDPFALTKKHLRALLEGLQKQYNGRGVELVEVASGWRFQTSADYSVQIAALWDEKPQRYSRALLETLALIAYRQPITRGDIEEIRGVSVSSNIMKTLIEREWVKIVGHREVPGRPAIYATTKQFLDYFSLHSLSDLPALAELRDLDVIANEVTQQLELVDEQSSEERGVATSQVDTAL